VAQVQAQAALLSRTVRRRLWRRVVLAWLAAGSRPTMRKWCLTVYVAESILQIRMTDDDFDTRLDEHFNRFGAKLFKYLDQRFEEMNGLSIG
jgi:hypothetical protein